MSRIDHLLQEICAGNKTIKQALEEAANKSDEHILIRFQDKNVFIRTISFHYTGKVKQVLNNFIVLADAAWVADSGRWANALATGLLSEVEPYPDEVLINMESIVDICLWNHALPREVK